jgi:nicotinamide-nucleotide amidase
MLPARLIKAARDVGVLISELHLKLVLAESCTAGLAAAALGGVPGGSAWLCGSAVVYRTETKIAWLGVDPPHFDKPEPDSVGPRTSQALAEALLRHTPEAEIAAAISGHLGPDAPPELDGRIFIRILPSKQIRREFDDLDLAVADRLQAKPTNDPNEFRGLRQEEAAAVFLEQIAILLRRLKKHDDGTHQQKNPVP